MQYLNYFSYFNNLSNKHNDTILATFKNSKHLKLNPPREPPVINLETMTHSHVIKLKSKKFTVDILKTDQAVRLKVESLKYFNLLWFQSAWYVTSDVSFPVIVKAVNINGKVEFIVSNDTVEFPETKNFTLFVYGKDIYLPEVMVEQVQRKLNKRYGENSGLGYVISPDNIVHKFKTMNTLNEYLQAVMYLV